MSILSRLQILIALVSLAFFATTQEPQVETPVESSPPEQSKADVVDQINALLAAHHEIDQLSGTVLVADGGEVIYQGAFGMANSDWGIPNAVDTKFRLASITKQFTSMVVMQLVQEGAIELDAPITKYLPTYPSGSGDKVTITHLLNHTSGIPSYTNRAGFMTNESKNRYSIEDFIVEFCSDALEFEPGAAFNYNNSGYFLLGAIVEAVTHMTYREVLQERIFTPLEMHDSGYADQYAVSSRRATGYTDILGGRRVAMWLDMSTPYAAGALYSTVGDMWKWDRALASKQLLEGELEELMYTPGLEDYAFGWSVTLDGPNGPEFAHSGGMPGVSTLISRTPNIDRCVIVLGNAGGTATHQIQQGIEAILEGQEPRAPLPRGDSVVAKIVLDEGIEAALTEAARWPEVVREEYFERDINMLGYNLIEQQRFDEAIQLFEFLTTAYPESSNTWDSLGEGHMLAGDREQAIVNYEKALELDPESTTVPAILEKLRR